MIAVLYTNPSSITGRAIGRAFGGAWGTARVANRRQRHLTYLVRWGSSRTVPWTIDEEVNCRDAIALAANKYAALECLSAHDVPTVPFSRSPAFDGTVLQRQDRHRGGTDILSGPAEDFVPAPGVHYTQFTASEHELRLHVFGGQVIRSQIKKGEDGDLPIRSHGNGYTFITFVNKEPNQSRKDVAVAAVQALGLDFGAVDMLLLPDGRELVLEVNTAPACDGATLTAYLDAIASYTDLEYTLTKEDEDVS